MTSRVSKQKACNNCVRSKSKCSFTQPSCSRCSMRNEPCKYINLTLATNRRRVNSSGASGEAVKDHKRSEQSTPARVEETGSSTMDISIPSPSSVLSRMESSELDDNLDVGFTDQPYWLSFGETPPSTFSSTTNIHSMVIDNHTTLQLPGVDAMMQQGIIQSFQGQVPPNPYSYRGPSNDILNQRHLIINENDNFALRDLNITHSKSISEAFESRRLRDVLATENPSTCSRETTNFIQPFILSSIIPPSSPDILTNNEFNYSTLLSIVKSYVNLLQSDGYRTPFIHPELYNGTQQHLSSMQMSSMAACSAAALSNRRSKQFARKATTAERERLVHDFHLYSCLQEWDALHAMCIYQITDLINIHEGVDWKPGVSLYIPFLLKMARRFRHNHSENLPKNAYSPDTPDIDWVAWTVKESVLRTIFLVNFINEATGHLHDVVSPYYEPLDYDGFLNMALPAPRVMWEATTAKEWRIQKERCQWVDGKMTVKLLLDAGNQNLDGYAGGVPGFGDSKELADLVIACGLLVRGS